MSLQLILEISNVQIISLVLNKEILCLAIPKVKPYRTGLGTGCMRSREYPVVKTFISFFPFLFFSLCVMKRFLLEMRIAGHILRYFGLRIETKGKFASKLNRPMYEAEVSVKPHSDRGWGGGGGRGALIPQFIRVLSKKEYI